MQVQTVMMVDDDEEDRMIFKEALEIASPESKVMTAISGANALEILQTSKTLLPAVIFLDLNMPKMNGWQCLKEIRSIKILQTIPVIIFTTSRQSPSDLGLVFNDVHFFTKPPKFSDLINGLRRVLDEDWLAINEMNKVAFS
jgi:CheY-like chemotaxis protein